MPQVIETVDVNVPVSTAYNQWTQFESFPNFLSYVESITQVTDTLTECLNYGPAPCACRRGARFDGSVCGHGADTAPETT